MRNLLLILFFTALYFSCSNQIETADSLTKSDFDRFHKLNLLDSNEQLFKFYSEYKKSVAGNFYTNKRLASYWIDEHDASKNKVEFAFYKDVAKIDTVYNAGLTYCPYLLVTRKDETTFRVCVEGSKEEIKEFFSDAIEKWTLLKGK